MCNFGSNWLLTEDLVRVFPNCVIIELLCWPGAPPIHENQALPGTLTR